MSAPRSRLWTLTIAMLLLAGVTATASAAEKAQTISTVRQEARIRWNYITTDGDSVCACLDQSAERVVDSALGAKGSVDRHTRLSMWTYDPTGSPRSLAWMEIPAGNLPFDTTLRGARLHADVDGTYTDFTGDATPRPAHFHLEIRMEADGEITQSNDSWVWPSYDEPDIYWHYTRTIDTRGATPTGSILMDGQPLLPLTQAYSAKLVHMEQVGTRLTTP